MQPRTFLIQGQDIQSMKWVYILPASMSAKDHSDWLQQMYQTFYRLMFLTRHKVWFKNLKTKTQTRVILVPSPHPLSKCDLMFLKDKGYPIKAKGCNRDSCFRCRKDAIRL